MPIRIQSEREDDVAIVRILPDSPRAGGFEVDLLAAEDVEAALRKVLEDGIHKILLDAANVTYMHSRAFWSIVGAAETSLENGGRLVLFNASSYLERLVSLTSASESMEVRSTIEEAREALS